MASDLNSVTLVGRLTRDAELKYSTNGTAIARFSIANTQSRKSGDQWTEESHFFDAVLLGRRADALQRYLSKGQQVVVLGTLQQNRWQDKQTGQNRSKVEILVNDIQLVGSRPGGGQNQGGYSNQGGGYNQNSTQGGGFNNQGPAPVDDGFDDDIPF
ncbi:single-stranded DNA-binding protein [Salinispira pacifica]|uniref:Single-stranded DNA-binding protein n=1 Tax=Salinispira pacifica TaxID=1307761 RepID=V5WHR9_9SPIO|nr:single-stranded DNA-binding protein [Salinispira pacifica]AHC14716.1 Single-stranded DNA-binding protein [Salinispira pacifica]